LRLGSSDAGSDPAGTTTRQAYDLLARGFGPGFNGPLAISVEMGGTNPTGAVQTLVSALKATPGIAAVVPSPPIPVPQGPELSFILLAIVFRSLLIPRKAAIMNLLSVGAAFGVLVAVLQWGWLGKVFGVTRTGPVTSFLPVMLFAILFGLSMDYEVFLLTRV